MTFIKERRAARWSAERLPVRPIATFDLTSRCLLRCGHCYFYAEEVPKELNDEVCLRRLRELRDKYGIRSAFWVGGEPALRSNLLRRATELFPRNALATSAQVPIPRGLRAGLLVSLDGPEEEHDALRGHGSFARAMSNVAALPERSFALMVTLTRLNLDAIAAVPWLVEQTRALGALVGFVVGGDETHAVGPEERDRAIDQLLEVGRRHPGTLLNPPASLELFRRPNGERWKQCIYRSKAIAFGPDLKRKSPCTFGKSARCDDCGCPVVGLHLAREEGDAASGALLRALFPGDEAAAG